MSFMLPRQNKIIGCIKMHILGVTLWFLELGKIISL